MEASEGKDGRGVTTAVGIISAGDDDNFIDGGDTLSPPPPPAPRDRGGGGIGLREDMLLRLLLLIVSCCSPISEGTPKQFSCSSRMRSVLRKAILRFRATPMRDDHRMVLHVDPARSEKGERKEKRPQNP